MSYLVYFLPNTSALAKNTNESYSETSKLHHLYHHSCSLAYCCRTRTKVEFSRSPPDTRRLYNKVSWLQPILQFTTHYLFHHFCHHSCRVLSFSVVKCYIIVIKID